VKHVHPRILLDGEHQSFARFHLHGRETFHRQSWHASYVNVAPDSFTDRVSVTVHDSRLTIPVDLMAEVPDLPRPSQLWKQLTPERKLEAATAFWKDENAGMEQAEAIATIAQRIKFRTKSVVSMPIEKKARQLAALAGVSEMVAARLLVAYHLDQQRPMMGSFLDALGITHENGLIDDEDMPAPPPEKLREAATAIASQYPREDVALYLTTLVWQDPDTWGSLTDAPEIHTA
jgi:hypothetical protein